MRKKIHPNYKSTTFKCACGSGNEMTIKSTLKEETISLDVCYKCHPFYTGKQKIIDSGGRVQKFQERFGKK